MLAKVHNKVSHGVIQAHQAGAKLLKALFWDRETEMVAHKAFTLATDIDVFLGEPHSRWERDPNENTGR